MKQPYDAVVKGNYTKPGVTRTCDGVNFTLSVKGSESTALILYKKGTEEIVEEIPLKEKAMGDVYSIRLKGFRPERYEYNYRIGENIVTDPWARKIVGKDQFGQWIHKDENPHKVRGGFAFDDYDWEGDSPLKIPYEDGIMYQLHVRGFTKSPGSRVKKKGTFLGVTEKIDYLKELGVNQILFMPVYDFDERIEREGEENSYREPQREPKINYWGYGPGHYFAPKPTFACHDAVREMKDMIKALHKAGIEVLMEVFFSEDMDPSMMLGCLEYWIYYYHVDGFSIVGNQEITQLAAKEPLFSTVKLLAPYFATDSIYGQKETPAFKNLAEFNGGFMVDARRFLKGDEDQAQKFSGRIRKNSGKCGVVNYITNHDGFTLVDLVSYEERHNEANGEGNHDGPAYNFSWNCGIEGPSRKKKIADLRFRQMKNAMLLLLLSQGTPMILAGDEFGNTQRGNNNPYCQDNEITWLDWSGQKKNGEWFRFVKEAIALRKKYGLLHQKAELSGADTRCFGYPDISFHGRQAWYGGFENTSRNFGVMYCGGEKSAEEYLYVAYNLHWNAQEFAIPKLPEGIRWIKVMDTDQEVCGSEEDIELKDQKTFTAKGRSILVLVGRKQ